MSRIGKAPIPIPAGVTVKVADGKVSVKGPKAPQGLEDLVTSGYIKQLPPDPMTGQPDWTVDQEDSAMSVDQQETGISDVHSASSKVSSDGTAYSSW